MSDYQEQLKGKSVAITGAAGTVGSELVRQCLSAGASDIRALDHSETMLFELSKDITDPRVKFFVTDIKSIDHLRTFFDGVQYVFHAAAYKHVPLCEMHPQAAIETNIQGVQNVVAAARDVNVERVLFTSSDKAVNPTNVMGTSKLMGERLVTAANALSLGNKGPIYAATRFGNVAGSSGSVIGIFEQQIRQGKPLTLTDRRMTRFMMSLEESVRLVIESLLTAKGGEVFVTKMPVVRIEDLADVMIDLLASKYDRDPASMEIIETGSRPGEKMFEELTTEEEMNRTYELENKFVVLPAWQNIYSDIDFSHYREQGSKADRVYNSDVEPAISSAELKQLVERILDN